MSLRHPLDKQQARKLLSSILATGGGYQTTKHFREQAAEDGLDVLDALNTLRCGTIHEPGEEERPGSWRYRVHTDLICVVICFKSDCLVTLVTIWRKKKR